MYNIQNLLHIYLQNYSKNLFLSFKSFISKPMPQNVIMFYLSKSFLSFLLSKSSFVITLTWGVSKFTIVERAVSTPDMNFEASIRNCESSRYTLQMLKFHFCKTSTSCFITGICVYSSIWPENGLSKMITIVFSIFYYDYTKNRFCIPHHSMTRYGQIL